MFEGHFVVLRKAPFRHAKWPISEAEKHHIAPWNGLDRNAKWALSESKTNIFGLCYGVYHKTVCGKMTFITRYLTFLYISFAKIFCQNKVKKNCKYVSLKSNKKADWGAWTASGRYALVLQWRFTGRSDVNLLLTWKSRCHSLFHPTL